MLTHFLSLTLFRKIATAIVSHCVLSLSLHRLKPPSGPALRVDSPPSSPVVLTESGMRTLLSSLGRSLLGDLTSALSSMEKKLDERLNSTDKKLTCSFYRFILFIDSFYFHCLH